jgi:hypothetical protein
MYYVIYKYQYDNFLYLFKKLQCNEFFLKKTYINKNKFYLIQSKIGWF